MKARQALALLVLAGGPLAALAADPPEDDASRELFLQEARIVKTRAAPGGITRSLRATLEREGVTHDANIQTIDEVSPKRDLTGALELDFRDSYRNNVAAYRLDRILGLRMVPVTVVREHKSQRAAFTWWVDRVAMSERERHDKRQQPKDPERWNRQMRVVRVFDQLIFNFDRNLGNLLIDKDWRVWMIDHTRAFKIFKQLRDEKQLADTCARELLAGLRTLSQEDLEVLMSGLLNDEQVEGLLGRRDRIVAHYDRLIRERGEGPVLYDLPR